MRIALASDEPYAVHATVRAELERRGHVVVPLGAVATGAEAPFVEVALAAAGAVARGECEQAVLLCWTGTGVSIAANKVPGIRAALCADPGTAAGARAWNDANVLCLSNRTLSPDMAREILAAWFDAVPAEAAAAGISSLTALDAGRGSPGPAR